MYNITYVLYNKKTDVIQSISCIISYNLKEGIVLPVFSFLLFIIITSFTPGPNNFMAMVFAKQYGLAKTIPFCLGVGIGFFIIIGLSSFFNTIMLNILPAIELPLTIFGVGYMLYLAYKILTSKELEDHDNEEEKRNLFFLGAFVQFINPKGILFGLTVVATYILPYYSSYISYLLFSFFLALVGVISTFSWALCGSVFQKALQQYRKSFNMIMALLLMYSAVSIVVH